MKLVDAIRPRRLPGESGWMTTSEYARKYGVKVSLIHSWIRRRAIKHVHVGNFYFVQDKKVRR